MFGFAPSPLSTRRGRDWAGISCAGGSITAIVITIGPSTNLFGLRRYCFAQFEIDLQDDSGDKKGTREPVVTIIPTYLSLFIFGFIYQLCLTYDALRLKNTIQVIGLCILNIGLLIEAAIEQVQIEDALEDFYAIPGAKQKVDQNFVYTIKPYLIATPCVMGVGTVLMSFAAWKLYDEFAWSIYKNISADLRLKRRYLSYQVRMQPRRAADTGDGTKFPPQGRVGNVTNENDSKTGLHHSFKV